VRHVLVICAVLGLAREASAQVTLVRISDRLAVGGAVGPSTNGDRNSGNGGADVAALVEVPVAPAWRVRAELGRASWLFDKREARPAAPARDTVSLTRGTVAVIHQVWPGPIRSFAGYVGGGAGAYRYGFRKGSGAHLTRPGVFGLAGLEIPADTPAGITAEVQIHAVNTPEASQVFSNTFFTTSLLVGARLRF
jgi:hypothetical protein